MPVKYFRRFDSMTVMVTGAGVLGAQIAAQLVTKGETPVLYDIAFNQRYVSAVVDIGKVKMVAGDILDLPNVIDTIQKNNVDRIIHTAALMNIVVKARPYTGVKVNVMGMMNMLEAARLTSVKRMVFTSTQLVQSGAMDSLDEGPYKEDFTMKFLSQMPTTVYSVTKVMGEYLGLSYFKHYGVDFAVCRLTGLFGPWLGEPAGEPSKFIYKFLKDAVFGRPVVIDDPIHYFPGLMTFVYSKDVAKACILACFADTSRLKQRVYYIAGDKPYTFKEAVEAMHNAFPGVEIRAKEFTSGWRETFNMSRGYSSEMAKSELGYTPSFTLAEAVKDYGDWLKKNT